ncbi:hypothetical protein ACSYDW_10910 [Paeniglutamicibacter sp. R2-26]|uniref:hypothetical protein n=1 Tax=Paeniglutamicibacter sp. R2-26 TaxID=3144417 RepID=UPI003EE75D93
MKSLPKAGNRTTLALLGATVLLVAMAFVLVLTRGAGAPVDPGSPAGVVQSYVTAVLAGDREQAAELLTPKALKDCPDGAIQDTGDLRVALQSTTMAGTGATVLVSITETRVRGPFGLGEQGYEDSFVLVPRDGGWAIDYAPWPLLACSSTAVK